MSQRYSEKELSELPFRDTSLDIEERLNDLLGRLTLKEKFKLLHARRFHLYDSNGINRLGIKFCGLTDGPLGVARHSSQKKNTRFPTTIGVAATWNPDLVKKMGIVIGKETRATGNHIILAPGINIERTPLGGRTFEYMSEDPYLTKEIAKQLVKGCQEQSVSACLKHYVANNQETNRRAIDVVIDERTLHEIYIRAFIDVVKEADPWSIMTCYNKVNGKFGSENKYILRDILIDKYGFSGFFVTDWLATLPKEIDTANCINAGLSLEMPFAIKYRAKNVKKALKRGKITENAIDDVVKRLLRTYIRVGLADKKNDLPKGIRNTKEHQSIARRIAEESMVLLKNSSQLLPLDGSKIRKITVLGPNINKKFGRFIYGGSSAVVPPYEITPLKGIKSKCMSMNIVVNTSNKDIKNSDAVILIMGLNHSKGMDSESGDKHYLELPDDQISLIKETTLSNSNVIVVLVNGSPIAMEGWIDKVPTILEAWYPGMEGGTALANVLFGEVNPSGKLPVTFPKKLTDSPAHNSQRSFPGIPDKKKPEFVYYDEGVFVGYRYFDEKNIDPLFPFGYGLSYTNFELSNLKFHEINRETIRLSIDIMNIGSVSGAEIIQFYATDLESSVKRPPKELIAFKKIFLKPNDKQSVLINIDTNRLSFYDTKINDFRLEPGKFKILVGTSSRDIKLENVIEI